MLVNCPPPEAQTVKHERFSCPARPRSSPRAGSVTYGEDAGSHTSGGSAAGDHSGPSAGAEATAPILEWLPARRSIRSFQDGAQSACHHGGIGEALALLEGGGAAHEGAERGRQARHQRVHRWEQGAHSRFGAAVAALQLHVLRVRSASGEQGVQNGTQGIDVAARRGPPNDLLDRDVAPGAYDGAARGNELPGYAEIDQHRRAAPAVEEHVGQLEVPEDEGRYPAVQIA